MGQKDKQDIPNKDEKMFQELQHETHSSQSTTINNQAVLAKEKENHVILPSK